MRKQLLALAVICIGVFPVLALPISVAGAAPTAVTSETGASTAGVSGAAVVQYAERFLGYPYTTVGNSPSNGFSCIGFVSYVYQSLGIAVPDDLGGAMAFAPALSFSDLLPGDVLFFQNTVWTGLSHTAIYIGGGRFIHAEWYNRGVVISSFTNDPVDGNYWTAHYLSANRPWTGGASTTVSPPAPASVPAPPSPPAQAPTGPTARVRVPFLNVRSGPSLNAGIRTAVRRGTRLTILGHRYGWYRVALPNGSIGWVIGAGIGKGIIPTVRSRTAAQSAASVRRPAVVGARASTVTPARTATRTRTAATVLAGGLRVHTAPSLVAPVRQTVAYGARLTFLRRWSGWIDVRLPSGVSGWVSGLYVSVSAPARSARTSVSRTRITRSPSARTATTRLRSATTARAALNVRFTPSLAAGIVSVVPAGGRFSILGWSHGWARVLLRNGGRGWISGAVIGVTAPSSRAPVSSTTSTKKSVITAGVRLHAGPGLARPVITLVAAGTRVRVLGSSGSWVRVRLPSRQTGYVYGIYVRT